MARPRSPYRALSEQGREYGLVLTRRDRPRLEALGRWYCLDAGHVVRQETPVQSWHPGYGGDVSAGSEYAGRTYQVKVRLGKLSRIVENAGNRTGPMVGNALVDDGKVAWYATQYGGTAARLPWTLRKDINPQFAAHAWMSADIGGQLERRGVPVLSEREIATATDRTGDTVAAKVVSSFVRRNGVSVSKRPDMAVVSPSGSDIIAIEIERDRNRPLSTYREKLIAYEQNPAVRAVWYICASTTTAKRVAAAGAAAFGEQSTFPLRIRVADHVAAEFHEIVDLDRDTRLLTDLKDVLGQESALTGQAVL